MKCDGTRAETRFRLSAKRTIPFKSAGASVQSTAGSRVVRINGSNAGYTMFRGSVKSTGYTIQLPVSPSLPLPCVTVCHHISTELYHKICLKCEVESWLSSQTDLTSCSGYGRKWTVGLKSAMSQTVDTHCIYWVRKEELKNFLSHL